MNSLELVAVTALARALHQKGVLQMGDYLAALSTAALAYEHGGDQPSSDQILEYIANIQETWKDSGR